jgi:hypothetical protein
VRLVAPISGLTDEQQRCVLGRNAIEQTLDVLLDHGAIEACTAIRGGGRVTAGDPMVIDRTWEAGFYVLRNKRLA